MNRLAEQLLDRRWPEPEVAETVLPLLVGPVAMSSAGFPYLTPEAWAMARDTVPHLFVQGLRVLRFLEMAEAVLPELDEEVARPEVSRSRTGERELGELELGQFETWRQAARVVRQVVLTATITAPPDLWLLRHILGNFAELGLLERLLNGEAIYPEQTICRWQGRDRRLDPKELEIDLHFLLARGLVEQYEISYRLAGHPRVAELLSSVDRLPGPWSEPRSHVWHNLFAGGTLAGDELESLLELSVAIRPRVRWPRNHWVPSLDEVEIGYRLVPIVLGLRAAGRTAELKRGVRLKPTDWSSVHPLCAAGALEVLTCAGWLERDGERYAVTRMGERGFARGPGPFGIVETYHPYLVKGIEILLDGRQQVWVRRGENLGASQDANRATFARANDSLDRFCETTGFTYNVFIEHAIGRGEATRQRFERSGDSDLLYFGADLEDAAIDAAIAQQEAGYLPPRMMFVRNADIGRPEVLLEALAENGALAEGAVMLVGNGFHEVREQTDELMVEVFRRYCEAGVLLLFTEENALSIDDLRATAWNTFHAGFRYVHEKSGQGLRPAHPRPPVRLGSPLRAAWSDCASAAGYLRLDEFSSRSRTIYPFRRRGAPNPSISVNHFFVPAALWARLAELSEP